MKAVVVKTEIKQYNSDLSTMLDRFVSYLDVSAISVRSYISGIKTFLRYLSDNGINTPNRETVIMYKKHLSITKSASTISLYLSALRRFFAWCESEGLYSNITTGIKSPKVDTGTRKTHLQHSR